MRKIFLVLVVAFFTSTSRAQNNIVVDPNASERAVSGSFNAIKVSGGIDLYLSQSDNSAIAVSAATENYKEGIKTVIENEVLKIYYEGEKTWKKKDRKLRAYVSFTDLKKLDASGACDIVIAGSLTVATFELQMSGACDFSGLITLNTLRINLSGASDVKISGTANTVDIVSSGASDVKGYGLVTDVCNANVSGASDVNITVNQILNAHASGASNINFKGTGLIKEMSSSGSSDISRKD
ncbi:MAG: head GIN domain-containing protein [Ferruginibacter sp.]